MKSIIVLIIAIFMINIANAQWYSYIWMSTHVNAWTVADFTDANFISKESGIYGYSLYESPSSGTAVWLNATTNGGNLWTNIYLNNGIGSGTYSIDVVRKQNTYFHIRGWEGLTFIDKSDNNGLTWKNIYGVCGFYKNFYAVDTSHYFVLYMSNYCPNNMYYIDKYENGVTTYKIDSLATTANVMFFPDSATGYIADDNHHILKSISGGTNWYTVFNDTLITIRKMFFISANIGYAAGDSGIMIKTIDGGTTWQYQNTGINTKLNTIFFINDTLGFAAGEKGTIIRTINGGNAWSKDITNTLATFQKIFIMNDSIGYAITSGFVYKTNINDIDGDTGYTVNGNQNLSIYPNPTKDNLTIETNTNTNQKLEITNLIGQTVNTTIINNKKATINTSAFANGVYILKLSSDKETVVRKFVKE